MGLTPNPDTSACLALETAPHISGPASAPSRSSAGLHANPPVYAGEDGVPGGGDGSFGGCGVP